MTTFAQAATPIQAADNFQEVQRPQRRWYALLWVVTAGEAAVFGCGLYQQLALGRPFGNHPISDGGLVVASLVVFAVLAAANVLMVMLELQVCVVPGQVEVRIPPLMRRIIPTSNIAAAEPRTYRPIMEYGGWGLRLSITGRGWAYNMRGNQGVQLRLVNGRDVLLGTAHPQELAAAIRQAGGGTRS